MKRWLEQQLPHAVEVADRIAVLDYGRVVFHAEAAHVRAAPAAVAALLSVAGPASSAVSPATESPRG